MYFLYLILKEIGKMRNEVKIIIIVYEFLVILFVNVCLYLYMSVSLLEYRGIFFFIFKNFII